MKNDKVVTPKSKEKKSIPAGKANQNTTKKNATAASVSNIITSAVGKVKAVSGSGLAGEGTSVSYDEER